MTAPSLVGRAVDSLREEVSRQAMAEYGWLLLAVVATQGLFTFGQRILLVSMSRDIEFDLRNDYFEHLQRLPLSFYQQSYTGDLMSRGTNDLQAVRMICGPAIMYSFNTLFTAAGALFFMARIDLQLTLLALGTMPLVGHDGGERARNRHRFGSAKRGDRHADRRIGAGVAVDRRICYAGGDRRWSSGDFRSVSVEAAGSGQEPGFLLRSQPPPREGKGPP